MADRWQQAKAVFQAALERDVPARGALLDEACAGDPELRREVDSLLDAHGDAAGFLSSPASPVLPPGPSLNGELPGLAVGTCLGPYEIVGLLAAGGMGQVYRARDPRLGRSVAVKVLPPGLAGDRDRVRRFELEAQAASALNDPHILVVYDVGTHEGAPYLVTELLEGSSLAEVIRNERLSVPRALEYAQQVARGLAVAHGKGIVHRDLKPANVFVTANEGVKILDFGLARLARPLDPQGDTAGQTEIVPLTREGVVLGTVGYMAPEQVRGDTADARSDIFSFGAVLYEMLAGQRAFAGDTDAETMTAILRDEPAPLSGLRPDAPAAVLRLVGRCLAKRPEDRFSSGREALFALEVAAAVTAPRPAAAIDEPRRRRPVVSWLAPATLGAAVATAALLPLVSRPMARPAGSLVVSSLVLPSQAGSLLRWNGAPDIALSPDGTRLAYVGVGSDRRPALWIRDLASTTVRELAGTANAVGPFWSPDGGSVGFSADDKLKTVAQNGGSVRTLCDAGEPVHGMGGGTWNRQDVILFSLGDALARVSASGGQRQVVRRVRPGELHLRYPSFLPDGRRFLYFVRREKGPDQIYVESLDGSVPPTPLQDSHSRALLSPTGHLLFVRDGVLLARAFDQRTLEPRGDPEPVATRVANLMSNGRAAFSVSESGALTYAEALATASELVWRDREGRIVDRVAEGRYLGPALAPDGRRVVVEAEDADSSQHVLWILDPARGLQARLPRSSFDGHHPHWAPDGTQVAFSSTRTGKWLSYRQRTDGLGEDVLIYDNPDVVTFYTRQWIPDGSGVLLSGVERDGRSRLWLAPVTGKGKARPLVEGHQGAVSPNGRWLAVAAKSAGRYEIYVLPFPALDTRWQVSTNGGNWPQWRSDSREILYVSEDRQLVSVPVAARAGFEAGTARPLFPLALRATDVSPVWPAEYDVEPGGRRFLVCQTPDHAAAPSVVLVTGWAERLRTP